MLPLLQLASNGEEHKLADARQTLADRFSLTEEKHKELLPSGQQYYFNNCVAWAKVYLERVGLLEKTHRAHFRISSREREVLRDQPEKIDIGFLKQFPEFDNFRKRNAPSRIRHRY